ncbi:Prolyl 4-hydroxylase subunit alpha-1 isoform A [Micractinium conductrix]|uniref:Prolyl 4-hydroxylase subunit alpha-1 isoform A n=1 Tax=Micractinium conductrix TaxID=554055 RepID=A0A2P6VES1_9CHLO|nr:Prolyl 4-hydroxylase subunit alpha-1 isoform A [Micractinium conductrix]|eukprot:PSC72571.1 Prolyl 4-hydroxylase subunit alpha-1 isoform A [Micractinium conductrix]
MAPLHVLLLLALSAFCAAHAALAPSAAPHPWFEPVSWKPRSFVAHSFATREETDHIIAIAQPQLRRSTVVGAGGESVVDTYRTSYGMFIKRHHDPVVSRLEERVALWTKYNMSHQEDIQVLRYGNNQQYKAHFDSLDDDSPRTATVLIYLSDVEEGGETTFPDSEWVDPSMGEKLGPWSPCAKGNVAMKPKRGDAIVFHSVNPDGKTHDKHALHTACPVLGTGVKYVAIFWIHTLPFRPDQLAAPQEEEEPLLPEECVDADPNCPDWAAAGECQSNPGFMRGGATSLGNCRKSCKDCRVCRPDDDECRRDNRVKAGFLPINGPGFF